MTKKWKADEMEMAINFRATRLSWVSMIVLLVLWTLRELILSGSLPLLPFLLLSTGGIVFWLTKLVLTRRLSGSSRGDDHEE